MKFALAILLALPTLFALTASQTFGQTSRQDDPYSHLSQDITLPSVVPPFEFHSDFWINLHHFLYQQAQPGSAGNQITNDPLTVAERHTWDEAVEFYRKNIIGHNLIFDDQMIAIDSALAENENASRIRGLAFGAGLAKVLNEVAPVYRRYWWSQHDSANRLWIATASPLFRTFGARLRDQLAAAYGTHWYPGLMRVDICTYAGPRLIAYTTGKEYGHAIMSSTNTRGQGLDVLEILFHEAAHTIVQSDEGSIGKAIQTAARARGIPEPADLWHALMFYTTGELTRRNLADLGISYEPYADKNDLWSGPWRDYRGPLSLFWRQHLDGKLSLEEAISKMVDALSLDATPVNGRH